MARPVKFALGVVCMTLVVWASFAGGQHLRRMASGAILEHTRLSSLEAGLASVDRLARDGDGGGDPSETFLEVLRYVKSDYVDRIGDDSKLSFGAVRTMLVSLDDPKTRFYDPDELKSLQGELSGQFKGIGASLAVVKQMKGTIDSRRLAVVAPIPGGPAAKAGLQPGDLVTEIDGHWVIAYDPRRDLDRVHVKEMDEKALRQAFKDATQKLTDGISLTKALEQLQGPDGKTLKLTVERPGVAEPVKLTVTTNATSLDPVEFKPLRDGVAYLRVAQFNDKATAEFSRELSASHPKKIILDLRDNFGGPISTAKEGVWNSALALLGQLSKGGQVGEIQRRAGKAEPVTVAVSRTAPASVVVLVNHGTANVAEMVAAALKENGGARIVGSSTFGDAGVQKLVPLRGGAAMTVTAGRFLTSKGVEFAGKGVQPDIAVAYTGQEAADDSVVQRAIGVLAGA